MTTSESERERLISKLADSMDPDNARNFVDRVIQEATAELLGALKTARRVLEVACGTTAPYVREAFKVIDPAIAKADGETAHCTCLSISRDPLCVYHGDVDKVRPI